MCSAVSPTDHRSGADFHFHCSSVTPSIAARNSLRDSSIQWITLLRSSAVICASAATTGRHENARQARTILFVMNPSVTPQLHLDKAPLQSAPVGKTEPVPDVRAYFVQFVNPAFRDIHAIAQR